MNHSADNMAGKCTTCPPKCRCWYNKEKKMSYMESCIPFPLEQNVVKDISEKAKDWAQMHGACMRSKSSFNPDALQFAPFLLLPTTFPRKEFNRAKNIQPILNKLIHNIAYDVDFLRSALANTIRVDGFTKRLFDIYETVLQEGIAQPISLGLIRSDLMLETGGGSCNCCNDCINCICTPYCCWKQVEINTIASGFGWMGPVSGMIHRYTLSEIGRRDLLVNLPENKALEGLCAAMLKAWEIYDSPKSVIMFLIEDVSYNICDQRFHEFEIRRQNPDVWVIRKTLTDIGKRGILTDDKRLYIDGYEVSVIYFRAGYTPDHYHSEVEWDARLMMERSRAIKSPSIQYHLAGTKKIQQELSKPGVLNHFLSDPQHVDMVKDIFTGLYSLDFDEYGESAVAAAISNPTRYVLKPQREGGGNNIYGDDVRAAMMKMRDTEERTAWILMDKINPPMQKNYMVRPGSKEPFYGDVISELGIFGCIIGDADNIVYNEESGFMLRTKLSTANEGGVAAGLGALDSLYLVDVEADCQNSCCSR